MMTIPLVLPRGKKRKRWRKIREGRKEVQIYLTQL